MPWEKCSHLLWLGASSLDMPGCSEMCETPGLPCRCPFQRHQGLRSLRNWMVSNAMSAWVSRKLQQHLRSCTASFDECEAMVSFGDCKVFQICDHSAMVSYGLTDDGLTGLGDAHHLVLFLRTSRLHGLLFGARG